MIAILLATYNSERYLSEQIDSILHQTYTGWKMYIRDDGSKDGTVDVIRQYVANHPDKIEQISDQEAGKGAYGNFVTLLGAVDADYYMFCDHDDYWSPTKIEVSFERMKQLEAVHPGVPIVVHTDMKVVDQDLNVLSESFWKYSRLLPDHTSFWELVCCNTVNGCTMLFNKQAKLVSVGNEPFCLMHDTLVSQSVAAVGGVISAVKEPTMLYRQHGDNVVGAADAKRSYFLRQMDHLSTTLRNNDEVWKRASHIKKASRAYFFFTKMKISLIRFLR